MAKFGRGAKPRWQQSYFGSITFDLEEILSQIESFADDRRSMGGEERVKQRMSTSAAFIARVAEGKFFDASKLEAEPYYDYLLSLQRGRSRHNRKRVRRAMEEFIVLYEDIKAHGLKTPLNMWRVGKDKFVLHRGFRRLVIMKELHSRGIRNFFQVPVRLFKNRRVFKAYCSSPAWSQGAADSQSIHSLGMKQFVDLGVLSTDKYWVHEYTRYYDRHLVHLRDQPIKLLEIGVFRGASLLLWREAFPLGRIFGVDRGPNRWKALLKGKDRIKVFRGRQEDENFLRSIVIPAGPYNVIIDDGGHTPNQQLASFEQMWPHVSPGGIYVIEDMQENYRAGRTPDGPKMTERIKTLAGDILAPNDCLEVASIACYYNICFIEKSGYRDRTWQSIRPMR
jgi:hypothetical protein